MLHASGRFLTPIWPAHRRHKGAASQQQGFVPSAQPSPMTQLADTWPAQKCRQRAAGRPRRLQTGQQPGGRGRTRTCSFLPAFARFLLAAAPLLRARGQQRSGAGFVAQPGAARRLGQEGGTDSICMHGLPCANLLWRGGQSAGVPPLPHHTHIHTPAPAPTSTNQTPRPPPCYHGIASALDVHKRVRGRRAQANEPDRRCRQHLQGHGQHTRDDDGDAVSSRCPPAGRRGPSRPARRRMRGVPAAPNLAPARRCGGTGATGSSHAACTPRSLSSALVQRQTGWHVLLRAGSIAALLRQGAWHACRQRCRDVLASAPDTRALGTGRRTTPRPSTHAHAHTHTHIHTPAPQHHAPCWPRPVPPEMWAAPAGGARARRTSSPPLPGAAWWCERQ